MTTRELRNVHERDQSVAKFRKRWSRIVAYSLSLWVVLVGLAAGFYVIGSGLWVFPVVVLLNDTFGFCSFTLRTREMFGAWPWRVK